MKTGLSAVLQGLRVVNEGNESLPLFEMLRRFLWTELAVELN